MSVESYAVKRQEREITACISDLKRVKRQLDTYKSALNQAWKSEEILYVNRAIDRALSQIEEQIHSADSLTRDISAAAAQIRAEKELEKLGKKHSSSLYI